MTGFLRNTRFRGREQSAALIAAVVLLVVGLVMAVFNEADYKSQKQREIGVQAQILSASVAPALMFDNSANAQEYLNALGANPDVSAAAVYNGAGARIAAFHRDGAPMPPLRASVMAPRFEGRDVVAAAAVAREGEQLGTVYLRTSAETTTRRFARYLGIGILVVMAALVLAVLGRAQGALASANEQLRAKAEDLEVQIAERAKAEAALLQSRKLEAIGQLTGGIAHDFNNLLTIVQSGVHLLQRHTDPAQRAATIEAMGHAIARGAGLTRQLLAFSRRQTLRLEAVDVSRQLLGMRELLERSLRADILVDLNFPDGLWPVKTDPAQFELAVLNLAVNARDAMPKGGVLTITASNSPIAEGADPNLCGDFVMISVRDTGLGIPTELLERVFEPYFTTKQTGQGTGLGLSQVYGFVTQSGGTVRLESVINQGTSVSILLPRSEAPALVVQPVAPVAEKERKPGAAILVVEDETVLARFICEMLEQMGHRPTHVPNAPAALEALAKGLRPDLLFSDIVMPGGMNGVELAREVQRLYPSMPILLTTGYAGAPSLPINFPILRKPYQSEELAQAISAVLAGGSAGAPASESARR